MTSKREIFGTTDWEIIETIERPAVWNGGIGRWETPAPQARVQLADGRVVVKQLAKLYV